MPKKQVYSPLNAADEESQHEYSQYRDDPDEHETTGNSTMPSSSASIKSALSKKSRKSRRRVDNDELSVPLHALSEDGGDEHDMESGTAGGAVMGAAVSLEDDPFYVFREDLTRKLCLVDEGLKRYLNVIHDTVSFVCDGWRLSRQSRRRTNAFSCSFVIVFVACIWVLFCC